MTHGPVLVTGAGGFVCSEIAVALVAAGFPVVAVDQSFDAPTRARLTDVDLVEGELPDVLTRLADLAPASVIHGAAITAAPEQLGVTRAAHIRRNIEMHTAVLDHARAAGAERFLFLSSMGVFDAGDGPAPGDMFTEGTTPTARCAYCAAKRAGEWLTASAAEAGFATLSLRLGNIVGRHEAARPSRQVLCLVSRMLAAARADGTITVETPHARREWAWLPDLASGIARLIEDLPETGADVLHAGSPPVQSDLDLARAIADRLDGAILRTLPQPHMPIRPPMASGLASVFDTIRWTPMDRVLDQLIPSEGTP